MSRVKWHCQARGGYSRSSQEAFDNCLAIYSTLYKLGWTLEAICGVLGNVGDESGYNPWRWQGDIVQSSNSSYIDYQSGHAYGLFQMDPAAKYIRRATSYAGYGPNYSDIVGSQLDGAAQCRFLHYNADYIPTSTYYLSYEAYKHATLETVPSISWLAAAWFYNYERGTWSEGRATNAEYWFNALKDEPLPIDSNLPIWFYFKINERRRLR